jgi:hypothetical protein
MFPRDSNVDDVTPTWQFSRCQTGYFLYLSPTSASHIHIVYKTLRFINKYKERHSPCSDSDMRLGITSPVCSRERSVLGIVPEKGDVTKLISLRQKVIAIAELSLRSHKIPELPATYAHAHKFPRIRHTGHRLFGVCVPEQ